MKTRQARTTDLTRALRKNAGQVAASTTRGTPSRRSVVDTVGTDGTITTTDGITALRKEAYRDPAVGDVVTLSQSVTGAWYTDGRISSGADAIGDVLFARKTADTGRTSTTLAADPDLTVTVTAGGVYRVECHISALGDAAADINIGWVAPSGFGGWWSGWGQPAAETSDTGTIRTLDRAWDTTLVLGTISTTTGDVKRLAGLLTNGAAGTFALRWCRNGTTATTTVRAGSWLELRRVA